MDNLQEEVSKAIGTKNEGKIKHASVSLGETKQMQKKKRVEISVEHHDIFSLLNDCDQMQSAFNGN